MLTKQTRRRTALAALAACALPLAGCSDLQLMLYIRSCAREAQDTCQAHADLNMDTREEGSLDVSLAHHYFGKLAIENLLSPTMPHGYTGTETAGVVVSALEVSLSTFDGEPILRADGSPARFTSVTNGYVDPGKVGLIDADLIDADTTAEIGRNLVERGAAQDVLLQVVARGQTLGGDEVESLPWKFPIHACRGCLVVFPPEADDPSHPGPDCDLLEDAPPSVCRLGLDEPVDCRTCHGDSACTP